MSVQAIKIFSKYDECNDKAIWKNKYKVKVISHELVG